MRFIDTIVIHCAATTDGMDIGAEEIRKWHTDPKPEGNGWSDIGYHAVIRRNGSIEPGRPIERKGAHVKGHNANSIGICIVGGIRVVDGKTIAANNFTRAQFAGLRILIQMYKDQHPGIKRVLGHRDLDPGKACPSFSVRDWMATFEPEAWAA